MTSPIATSSGVGQYRPASATERHVLLTDSMYKPNASRYGVIFCHGAGATGTTNLFTGGVDPSFRRYIAAGGYPVLSCDLSAPAYAGSNWANTDHVDAITAAYTYLTTTCGAKVGKVLLLGSSMGAQGAMAWARQNPSLVLAVAGLVPVIDLDAIYQGDILAQRASIQTAYGIVHPTPIPSLGIRSPVAFGATDLAGLPLRAWCSTNDPIGATPTAMTTWGGSGATLTVTSLGAVAHSSLTVNPQQVLDFLDASGGRQ